MSNTKLIKALIASPEFEEAVKGYIEALMKKSKAGPASKKASGPFPGAWDRVILVEEYTTNKDGSPRSVALVGPFGSGGEYEQFNTDNLKSIGRFNGNLAVGAGRTFTPAQAAQVKKILKKGKIPFETMSRKEAEEAYTELKSNGSSTVKPKAAGKKAAKKPAGKKAAKKSKVESDTEEEELSSDSEEEEVKPKKTAKGKAAKKPVVEESEESDTEEEELSSDSEEEEVKPKKTAKGKAAKKPAATAKGKATKKQKAEETESEEEVSSDSEEEEVKPKKTAKGKAASKKAPVKSKGRNTSAAATKSLKSVKAVSPKNLKANRWGNLEEKDNTSGVVYRMVGGEWAAIGIQDTSKKSTEKHLKSIKSMTEDERKSVEDRGFTVLSEELAEKAPAKDKAALKALVKVAKDKAVEEESEESESESEEEE